MSKAAVRVYTGGGLLRPAVHVFTESGSPATVLREHRNRGGEEVHEEMLAEREFPEGWHGVADWTQGVVSEWLSHQPLPEYEDLDTGIVYEMEEVDLPETVKRYRRLW